jgi:hypothetical protein
MKAIAHEQQIREQLAHQKLSPEKQEIGKPFQERRSRPSKHGMNTWHIKKKGTHHFKWNGTPSPIEIRLRIS